MYLSHKYLFKINHWNEKCVITIHSNEDALESKKNGNMVADSVNIHTAEERDCNAV